MPNKIRIKINFAFDFFLSFQVIFCFEEILKGGVHKWRSGKTQHYWPSILCLNLPPILSGGPKNMNFNLNHLWLESCNLKIQPFSSTFSITPSHLTRFTHQMKSTYRSRFYLDFKLLHLSTIYILRHYRFWLKRLLHLR